MPLFKKKPLVPLQRDAYLSAIADALAEGIKTTARFALYAETTADSARLINDLFSDADPDDPDNLLYVNDFTFDLPISRAPESEMYVFLTYAFHVAAAYSETATGTPAADWVPATQPDFYPTGRLHAPDLSRDLTDAFLLYGDPGLIRAEKTHNLNRQQLQFAGMCMIYTMLAVTATETNRATVDVIDEFQRDLANPGATLVDILHLPQTAS